MTPVMLVDDKIHTHFRKIMIANALSHIDNSIQYQQVYL